MRKINALPIGYSDVRKVIHTGYYVDKTRYAQELIERGNPIFIARPRRLGKSLFIDTLANLFKRYTYLLNFLYLQDTTGYLL